MRRDRAREPTSSLRRRLYVLAFLDEIGPVYALFTLWFVDNGVSAAQISTVFVMWAVLTIVLEIPSGVVADRLDKRVVIASAFGLRAAGIATWFVWPTVGGLLIGGLLWAIHDAAASGAWEALIHDELSADGEADAYGVVIARANQAGNVGVALGALAAIPIVASGAGIAVVGWITVAFNVLTVVLVLRLPDVRWVSDPTAVPSVTSVGPGRQFDATTDRAPTDVDDSGAGVRAALADVRRSDMAGRLLLVGSAIGGLAIIDEFVPLLARVRGASDAAVPVVYVLVWLGLVLGSEIAARRPDLGPRPIAAFIAVGGIASIVAVATEPFLLLGLIAVGYAAIEVAWTIGDARLQARLPAATRATATSLRGVGEGIIGGAALGMVGLLSGPDDDPTAGMLILAGALLVLAALAAWAIPAASITE
ncbi:MAG: MFS transporter [Actinomycetota bacterium]